MSTLLSIASPFIQTSNLLFGLLLLGTILMIFWPNGRLGRRLVKFSGGVFVIIGLLPLYYWLYLPLDNRFPIPDLPEQVTGIIVLGGAANPQLTAARGQVSVQGQAERLIESANLARRYPQAKVIYTGGKWSPSDPMSEADVAARFFADQGLSSDRLVLEQNAKNTFENAINTYDLIKPQPDQKWLLVTTASHMPRSVGVFRKVGWQVIPYPVDYKTHKDQNIFSLHVSRNIRMFDRAMRAWTSLLGYYLLGRIDSVFPGPDPAA